MSKYHGCTFHAGYRVKLWSRYNQDRTKLAERERAEDAGPRMGGNAELDAFSMFSRVSSRSSSSLNAAKLGYAFSLADGRLLYVILWAGRWYPPSNQEKDLARYELKT